MASKINIERLLLSRMLNGNNKDRAVFERYPFHVDMFRTYNAQYKWLSEFKDKYGKYPGAGAFNRKFKEFKIVSTKESMSYYCDQLIERENLSRLRDMADRMTPLIDSGKVSDAIALMSQESKSLAVGVEAKAINFKSADLKYYKTNAILRKKLLQKGRMFDTPYKTLNELISFIQAGNLVTLSGRPAIGKTWILLFFALYWFKKGHRVLLISKEMTEEEVQSRLDAIEAYLDWPNYRRGELTLKQRRRFKKMLLARSKCKGELFIVGNSLLTGDVIENLSVEINNYRPDTVLVDGIQQYDVRGAKGEVEKVLALSRITKRIAKIRKVPIIQTVHQNRESEGKTKGGGLGGLAWGDQIAKDSDMVFEFFSPDKSGKAYDYRIFKIIKGRDTGYGEFCVNFKMAPRVKLTEAVGMANNKWARKRKLSTDLS